MPPVAMWARTSYLPRRTARRCPCGSDGSDGMAPSRVAPAEGPGGEATSCSPRPRVGGRGVGGEGGRDTLLIRNEYTPRWLTTQRGGRRAPGACALRVCHGRPGRAGAPRPPASPVGEGRPRRLHTAGTAVAPLPGKLRRTSSAPRRAERLARQRVAPQGLARLQVDRVQGAGADGGVVQRPAQRPGDEAEGPAVVDDHSLGPGQVRGGGEELARLGRED